MYAPWGTCGDQRTSMGIVLWDAVHLLSDRVSHWCGLTNYLRWLVGEPQVSLCVLLPSTGIPRLPCRSQSCLGAGDKTRVLMPPKCFTIYAIPRPVYNFNLGYNNLCVKKVVAGLVRW